MISFYYKKLDPINAEAWVESSTEVLAYSKLILADGKCFIATIDTDPKHQKKGYATLIINKLVQKFDTVEPINIIPTAQGFWDKFNMKDGCGEF